MAEKKTCVITGASAGIGKATAIEMAALGYSVVILVRDSEKSRSAAQEIKAASRSDDVRMVFVDLASRASITSAVGELKRLDTRIDVLTNNAGVYKRKRELSADGIEMTLAVNFVAPFLLTELLLPLMKGSADGRIVNLTSEHYRSGSVMLDNPRAEGKFKGDKAYSSSKLMVVLFTRELARRLNGTGITANCAHPGVVGTDVFREYPRWVASGMNLLLPKPEAGAKPSVYLATSPELKGVTGQFFSKTERKDVAGEAADDDLALKVWAYGEELSGMKA